MKATLSSWTRRALPWLRQLHVMTVKELRQLSRDTALVVYIVYIFTLQIFLAAGEAPADLHLARLVVLDEDRSAASRELVSRFQPPYFQPVGAVRSTTEGLAMLDRGQAVALLDIPSGFAETLRQGRHRAEVQLFVDTSKSTLGYLTSSYSARIVSRYGAQQAERRLRRGGAGGSGLPAVEERTRIWYNPALDPAWFGTLSEWLTMLTVVCILLPAAALAREKERGTIEQLLVSPLSPMQVMLSKVVGMTLVMLAGTAVALFGIMRLIYQLPMNGSLLLFFVMTALYTFTNAGLGLVVATFTRKTGQVGMVVLLTVMPIVMLSGIRTPPESLPPALRTAMSLSPLRHFIELTYGILLRGAGLEVLWDSALAMALLGAALFGIGLTRLRRQFG
jgi:ABC-2 type transport system permease protein